MINKRIFVLIVIGCLMIPASAWTQCWKNLGTIKDLTPTQQCQHLKDMAAEVIKQKKCRIFAFSWIVQAPDGGISGTYILFDGTISDIYRVSFETRKGGSRKMVWEQWNNVLISSITSANPAEGFNFKNHTKGEGVVPLMLDPKEFVQQYAPREEFRDSLF